MSVRTLPLVFINLGGEMLYILDQRLRAHNTSEDNSEKVMNDIVGTMFSKAFMDELLKPQQLYSHRTMKTVLTRLAHASIMRLNPASMERLYELMVMAFKYQVFLCPRPKDLLLISYNHIDAIREFVRDTPVVLNQVDETHRKIIEVFIIYSPLSAGEFQLLRQTLASDCGLRSVFCSGRRWTVTGRELRRTEFPYWRNYTQPIREGSFELYGNRVIRLGMNMYTVDHPEETHTSKASSVKPVDDSPNLLAKEELNLLARLMGTMKSENTSEAETGFRINLFTTDEEEKEAAAGGAEEPLFGVINIQAMQDQQATTELARIAGQFAEEEEKPENHSSSKGDDLLAMMDHL
uniref:Organic solute carrier partner 1a n=1 Tax=Amphiprion percula TaxID=161767 RepID=A0A3P8U014_AMPPE